MISKSFRLRTTQTWLLALAAGLVVYIVFQNFPIPLWSSRLADFAHSQGLWGVALFTLIYIFATLTLFPCAFLTFAAGAAYGWWAVPIVTSAALIGAALAYGIARSWLRGPVERVLARRRETQALKTALEEEGWIFLILVRMSPFVPFNVNNYFLGTLRVSFLSYFIATFVGSFPGTLLYVYLGVLGKKDLEGNLFQWALFGVGVIATLYLAKITLTRTKEILRTRDSSSAF
ncbi:MAG: TVP38/TMEM64 family protein [Bdellovibrionales bacterium]